MTISDVPFHAALHCANAARGLHSACGAPTLRVYRQALPEPMPKVVIYTTPFCPYCLMAKRLLGKKGVTSRRSTSRLTPLRAQ